jgi:chromosome segregation protein
MMLEITHQLRSFGTNYKKTKQRKQCKNVKNIKRKIHNPKKQSTDESNEEKVKEVESSNYSCGDKLNPCDIRCTSANKSSFDKDKDESKIHASEQEENDEVEVEVYLDRELISALYYLRKEREKKKMIMEQLQRYQENNTLLEEKLSETEKTVNILKEQVEVAKKTVEILKNKLEEKDTQLSTNL